MRSPLRPRTLVLALPLLLALGLALAVVLATTPGSTTRGPSPSPQSIQTGARSPLGFDGAALPPGITAPGWTLTDQNGRRAALSGYRGQVLILTFLSATQTGTSPLVAQQIRGALDELPRPAAAIAISADPAADTPSRVRAFLAAASLSGRMEYLTGTAEQLRPLWRSYRITPASAGRARFERAATVLLIDARGRERVLFGVEGLTPEALAHDIRKLQTEQ
jgi:protein SCO1/2